MKLHSIEPDGSFKEYVKTPFQLENQELVLESWLERNPDAILEDGPLLIIGRQVPTNLGSIIDLLALDRRGDTVVIELKRNRTPRDTLAQGLEYASFVEDLDADQLEEILRDYIDEEEANLAEQHRAYFKLENDEAVSFNKDQRIVIVGQDVTKEICQTSQFLRSKGVRVTCVEFRFFTGADSRQLISNEIVVGHEVAPIRHPKSGALPIINEGQFLESCDDYGKPFFQRLLGFAKEENYQTNWGTNGFSLNVQHGNGQVALAFGYRSKSVYGQSLYTVLYRTGGALAKAAVPQEALDDLGKKALQTGFFMQAGSEFKIPVNRGFSNEEMSTLRDWLRAVAAVVHEQGVQSSENLSAWQEFCRKKRLLGKDFKEIATLWKAKKDEAEFGRHDT